MPRTVQSPDPVTILRSRLCSAEQAASEIVLAVESLRAALRQVVTAADDLPGAQPSPRPAPPPNPAAAPPQPERARILRPKAVVQMVGLSRVTLWKLERDGKFPPRRRLSANTVGWLAEEVEAWNRSRERGR